MRSFAKRTVGALALAGLLAACGGGGGNDIPAANPNGALTEADITAAQNALDTALEVSTSADASAIDASQSALDSAEIDLTPIV